ncbi:Uncharacterized protein HZ326_24843 [Fusarium oxysporum f. sp. albedinis]|nr:Uncharacterized protein HZ326_24843 [Fusarium oxysporum f. sp. albedinis]
MHTLSTIRKQFRLTKAKLGQLRSIKTLPGIYSMEELRLQAMRQIHSASSGRHRKFNFMGSCALPYYNKISGNVEHGMSYAGYQLAFEKDIIGAKGEKWAFEAQDKAQLLWKSSCKGKSRPAELPEAARRGGYFNKRD